jgi:hypothetical protein
MATLQPDGSVLIIREQNSSGICTAERYDPTVLHSSELAGRVTIPSHRKSDSGSKVEGWMTGLIRHERRRAVLLVYQKGETLKKPSAGTSPTPTTSG